MIVVSKIFSRCLPSVAPCVILIRLSPFRSSNAYVLVSAMNRLMALRVVLPKSHGVVEIPRFCGLLARRLGERLGLITFIEGVWLVVFLRDFIVTGLG